MESEGDIVERARSLVPVLERYRADGEANARLAPEVVSACRSAGMYALYAPVEVGGEEAALPDVFRVMVTVAEVDPSAAWLMVNSCRLASQASYLDRSRWAEVFRPPLGPFGLSAAVGGTLEPSGNGYVLSGSWPLVTGVLDAPWANLNCRLVTSDGRTRVRAALVRTAELSVEEIWADSVAMRGTGSHRVRVDGLYLPPELVIDASQPPAIDRSLQRVPFLVGAGVVNAAVPVGIARSAVSAAAEELSGKVSTVFGGKAAESTALLELIADAAASVGFLERGVLAAVEELWSIVDGGEEAPPSLRALIASAPFRAIETARDVISRLYARSSMAAFFTGHPLERALRNIHAVAYGNEPLRPIQHAAGRVALGLEPGLPL